MQSYFHPSDSSAFPPTRFTRPDDHLTISPSAASFDSSEGVDQEIATLCREATVQAQNSKPFELPEDPFSGTASRPPRKESTYPSNPTAEHRYHHTDPLPREYPTGKTRGEGRPEFSASHSVPSTAGRALSSSSARPSSSPFSSSGSSVEAVYPPSPLRHPSSRLVPTLDPSPESPIPVTPFNSRSPYESDHRPSEDVVSKVERFKALAAKYSKDNSATNRNNSSPTWRSLTITYQGQQYNLGLDDLKWWEANNITDLTAAKEFIVIWLLNHLKSDEVAYRYARGEITFRLLSSYGIDQPFLKIEPYQSIFIRETNTKDSDHAPLEGRNMNVPTSIEDFLTNIDLQKYSDTFKQQEISLDDLMNLSEAELKEIGVKLVHAKKISREIETLRSTKLLVEEKEREEARKQREKAKRKEAKARRKAEKKAQKRREKEARRKKAELEESYECGYYASPGAEDCRDWETEPKPKAGDFNPDAKRSDKPSPSTKGSIKEGELNSMDLAQLRILEENDKRRKNRGEPKTSEAFEKSPDDEFAQVLSKSKTS